MHISQKEREIGGEREIGSLHVILKDDNEGFNRGLAIVDYYATSRAKWKICREITVDVSAETLTYVRFTLYFFLLSVVVHRGRHTVEDDQAKRLNEQ